MDLRAAKTDKAPKLAWARTGALILFLVTGLLLVASLNSARSQLLPVSSLSAGTVQAKV